VLIFAGVSTPARVSTKKVRVPKQSKLSVSNYKGTSKAPGRLANLREQSGVRSPSTPTETSSSEDESSSEESEYEDEKDMAPIKEIHEVSFEKKLHLLLLRDL
jgi:hypothetical protein